MESCNDTQSASVITSSNHVFLFFFSAFLWSYCFVVTTRPSAPSALQDLYKRKTTAVQYKGKGETKHLLISQKNITINQRDEAGKGLSFNFC